MGESPFGGLGNTDGFAKSAIEKTKPNQKHV